MDIKKIVNKNLIIHDCNLDTKEAVIEELVVLLENEKFISSKELFLKEVLEREKLSSTGLEKGIAIPHGKCKEVLKPGIGFCRCKEPFIYESSGESGEVKYIFVLAISENQENDYHLRVLATLAGMLAHKEFLELLEKAESYDDLIHGIKQLQL